MTAFIPFDERLLTAGLAGIKLISEGKEFLFVIDTGSNCSHLDADDAKKLKQITFDKSGSVIEGLSDSTKAVGKATVIFRKGIFGFKHEFLISPLCKIKQDIKEETDVEINGILGTDFLIKNKCHVDFKKNRLHLS